MSEMTWMFFGAFLSFRGIYTEQVVIRDQQRAYRMKAEHMRQLFYTPEYAKTGDVIPFYNEKTKRFENYYLKNWNPDAPKDLAFHGWYRIVTEDLRTYVETPTKIQGGTGSVICVDGLYHMFYCTFDRDPAAQWARHATSVDLVHWKDIPSGMKRIPAGGCFLQQEKTERQSAMDALHSANQKTFHTGLIRSRCILRICTRELTNVRIYSAWGTGITWYFPVIRTDLQPITG